MIITIILYNKGIPTGIVGNGTAVGRNNRGQGGKGKTNCVKNNDFKNKDVMDLTF